MMESTMSGVRLPSKKKRSTILRTSIQSLSSDSLCVIFSFLDLFDLVRCLAVCKSWRSLVDKSNVLQILYCKQQQSNCASLYDPSTWSKRSLTMRLEELAMDRHRFSLQEGSVDIYQWRHFGVNQCRMKMGLVLTGGVSKMMRLWSVESYKCLDEYCLPDGAPLVDFDFDESKVVGLVGTHVCIWKRYGKRGIFYSREGEFPKGSCMRFVDPEAVVGCEDGRARVFDMYSRKWSQIIKIHDGPVTCLSLSEEQLIISGSSIGSIAISCRSSNDRVAMLKSSDFSGIKTLCFNPSSYLLFSGSYSGHASCWDLRTMKSLWGARVSPNVIYSIDHLQNDTSTLAMGGIDGVLRVVEQGTGEICSRFIMDGRKAELSCPYGVVEKRKARRISEDTRLDLMPKALRPSINCLAVGMQKVVTTHDDNYIRAWKFSK